MSEDRYRGCLVGLATGDAVGTTLEFQPRGTLSPIDDMVGGGPFNLAPGQWTDDTSMALCLATSLVENNGFDPADQMNRYVDWREYCYLSSTGECFDIGATVSDALTRFQKSKDPYSGSTAPNSAGNGSIMRLAPVVLYYASDPEAALRYAAESSRTTHGAPECLDGCWVLARLLLRALRGDSKGKILTPTNQSCSSARMQEVADIGMLRKSSAEIRGTGYVVDSLEAAVWCFSETSSFREAILLAANLGDDADTTAAICGQLAGAHYGMAAIPKEWRRQLTMLPEIIELSDRLNE